ncbi:uncharacterized protein LOC119696827 isoform X2 [Motacilla alba alba]|uniref:uncharacterized protein LOC119696827 isoform X2 n=1 Tax=Motacilla alba alba TaxID=1094192 RepID=UPI0018D50023|nr:uncharacterized protein LOC119696827 isoform X2 [Motacilla alba alba]
MVTMLQHCSLSLFLGSQAREQQSRLSGQAIRTGQGVVADSATMASASEHGQSVRPEVLGILKNMQQDKIHGRASHPGLGGSPEQEVKPDISSQVEEGKAIDSECHLGRLWQQPWSCGIPCNDGVASERSKSMWPEELGILWRTPSKRQRPSDSRNFPAREAAFLHTRHGLASPDV